MSRIGRDVGFVKSTFVKSHLIEHHLSYNNQSKDILNVFDLVLMRNCYALDIRKF